MVDTVWRDVRGWLRERLVARDFDTWITPIHAGRWADGELVLEVGSGFVADWLRMRFLADLEAGVRAVVGGDARVRVVENPALAEPRPERRPPRAAGALSQRPQGRSEGPSPLGRFETFVVGASNRVAYEAARAVVERPGARFNPLFIHGGVGLGKTHLLGAIANALGANGGRSQVASISAENFVNEMIAALQRRQMERFRQRFRGIGILIVDDIQFFADKQRSQEEFTHTFNALYDGRKQIVVASDRAPSELPGFGDTLKNRFAAGLLADIQPPDGALRLDLVRRKATDRGLVLDEGIVEYLADRWCANGRELEGALQRIEAFASLGQRPLTLALVREALAACRRAGRQSVTVERIVGEVCRFYGLTEAELRSKSRARRLAGPRQIAMYLCRRHTETPLGVIGAELGGRDHSTVVHALGAIEERLARDAELRATLLKLEGRLAT